MKLAPGLEELRGVYTAGGDEIASNDTSRASGYAPPSSTEELVLGVERFLNSADFKSAFPDTGQDVKVMAVRQDQRLGVTVAMPLSCRHVRSEAGYFARKDEILQVLAYLTLTGTSAEDAESGQVGRGNRANGLIPFSRRTARKLPPARTLLPTRARYTASSAIAGRAWSMHGVLRSAKSTSIWPCGSANQLTARGPVYRCACRPDRPSGRGGDIRQVIDTELARLPAFRAELIRGEHPVC